MQVKINKKITSQSDKAKRNFWGQLMKQKELQIMVIIGMFLLQVQRSLCGWENRSRNME